MITIKAIYLFFSIYETFGQMTSKENKAFEEFASTTNDKVSNVLRDILNQESLVRFSMVQKIQSLILDVTDGKSDIEYLKKKLDDVIKELQTLEAKNRQMENENADLKQKLNKLYVQGDHNNRSIETMKTWKENISLILDEIRFAQNVSSVQQLLKSDQLPSDCRAIHDQGERTSGVYRINPWGELSDKTVQVYCDMVTAGGGWTVIQNRVDGKVNFSRSWQDYKTGFGDVLTSYWIGNDVIHQLTKENNSSLYVSITGKDGTTRYIQYDTFSISGEDDDYRLYIAGKATGTLEDRIRNVSSGNQINLMKFSTYDKDNDNDSSNCVKDMGMGGGWWFNYCSDAFLNGQYPPGKWSQPWHPRFPDAKQISTTWMMIKRQ